MPDRKYIRKDRAGSAQKRLKFSFIIGNERLKYDAFDLTVSTS